MVTSKRVNAIVVAAIAAIATARGGFGMDSPSRDQVFVAAPIDTDAAGRGGPAAVQAVVRVMCPTQNSSGTGFTHRSGKIITAAHVVAGCQQPLVLGNGNVQLLAKVDAFDSDIDLALLSTNFPVSPGSLALSESPDVLVGTQVTTWGFPGGYSGIIPLLSVGYLAGVQAFKTTSGKIIRQWVVNAAFNSGNSGGPLVHLETGKVIGVVSSKLAPISPQVSQILSMLKKQENGFVYTATSPDGTAIGISEAQLIAEVLTDLRSQVQLVIGYAVTMEDIKIFLTKHNIDP